MKQNYVLNILPMDFIPPYPPLTPSTSRLPSLIGKRAQSVSENVDIISRSRGFKKIIGGLREKEQNFTNTGSTAVR